MDAAERFANTVLGMVLTVAIISRADEVGRLLTSFAGATTTIANRLIKS